MSKQTDRTNTITITLWQAKELLGVLDDYAARLDEDRAYCLDPEEAKNLGKRGKLAVRLWRGVWGEVERRKGELHAVRLAKTRNAARLKWLKPGAVCYTAYSPHGYKVKHLSHTMAGVSGNSRPEYATLQPLAPGRQGDCVTYSLGSLYKTLRAANAALAGQDKNTP